MTLSPQDASCLTREIRALARNPSQLERMS